MSTSDGLDAARSRIAAAYDPSLLSEAGHRLADVLSAHLARSERSEGVVLPWVEPSRAVAEASRFLGGSSAGLWGGRPGAERGSGGEPLGALGAVGASADTIPLASAGPVGADREGAGSVGAGPEGTGPGGDAAVARPVPSLADHFAGLAKVMLERGLNLHDPRYIGHQVPAPVPLAGLFDAVGSVTNQVMAIYEMGPWATAVEQALVAELGAAIGWPAGSFSGAVTHGGSLANLTGLLTARNVTLGDSWEDGLARGVAGDRPRPVLLVHEQAHYSVARAAGILGLGSRQVIRVGLDERGRMDPGRLDEELACVRAQGRPVVAVVACACATPTGAFDPLNEIADVCKRHEVWLHVDAAHGGAAVLSDRHRHLVAGLERADSVVWDAHKMLFVPGLCAFVFYRDKAHRFEAFRQDAPYLFDPAAPGLADYDSGMKTVECTKRAAAFGLWGVWCLFGRQLFADMVDVTFALGRTLYEKLLAADDFVPLVEPECNIVVFRHIPAELRNAPSQRLGSFQLELRRRLIESGEFYIVPFMRDGVGALRVTIINPLTTSAHLDGLMEALRRHGRALLHG